MDAALVAAGADLGDTERRRHVRRLRSELRRISSRDFFSAPSGAPARASVDALAAEPIQELA